MSNRVQLLALIAADLPTNGTNSISAADVRTVLNSMVNSTWVPSTDGTPVTATGNVATIGTGTVTVGTSKAFTVSNTLTLTGTDGSTLNIGTGGTLGTAAYTAASAYEVPLTFSTGLTRSTNTISVNTTQNILKISGLTTNGVVQVSGGDGTLGSTAPGTSGNVLTSNGTAWISAAPPTGSLPSQTGNNGKFLTTDGTNASWATASGTGNVSNTGTPTSGQAAEWTNSTTIQGVSVTGTGSYVKSASPTLTGTPLAPTASVGTNTAQIATAAFHHANLPVLMANANGILVGNTAAQNTTALQALIDANTANGAIIYFSQPVPMNGGLVLKENIKLAGNNYAARKGSGPQGGTISLSSLPTGAAFLITDTTNVFMTVDNNTAIDGIIFAYPSQNYAATSGGALVTYPVTIKKAASKTVEACSFTNLTFVGNTSCFDFYSTSDATNWCSDLVFDLIYAYPLGGYFIKMQYCLDIPRINRCHINPGAGDTYLGHLPVTDQIIAYVRDNAVPTFELEKCDEFMFAQCFAYGVNTAYKFTDCYGTLVDCNADQVNTGVYLNTSTDYKYIALVGFSCVLYGFNERNAIVDVSTAGALMVTQLSGTSLSGNANSLVKVGGSGAHTVTLFGARAKGVSGGTFDKFIDPVNGSAIVQYFDSDQSAVTTPSAAGQVTNIALTTPILGTPQSGNFSNCTADGTTKVGFLSVPANSQSTAYTAVLADSGKSIDHPSTDANARTFTIPANASVAYPIGTCLSFSNMTSQVVTIAITSDTMYLAGTGTTGSRSLSQYGVATARKLTSTSWIINGTGLT